MEILLTGASGFLGQHILKDLADNHHFTPAVLRKPDDVQTVDFSGIDTIVHAAALVHQSKTLPQSAYDFSNHQLTIVLANQAMLSGVKHFIFISTVAVYGDHPSVIGSENSKCVPNTPYGISKYNAEQDLQAMQNADFKVSILRIPMVYGEEQKGNFQPFVTFHHRSRFIPFKHNPAKRSMVYVGNVTAMIKALLDYNGDQTIFLVADQKDPMRLGDVSSKLLSVLPPKKHIHFALPKYGQHIIKKLRPRIYAKLFGDFIIDPSVSFKALNFTPPFTTDQGLQCTVEWYLSTQQGS